MTVVTVSVFDCIEKFKKYCVQSKSWKVYECADLIQVENKFYKFVWTQNLRHLTFENMIRNPLFTITEGILFKTMKISFMAFVLAQPPSPNILRSFEEEPSIQRWVAVYDLSGGFGDAPVCAKLNETQSLVFKEFETFLSSCYATKFESILHLRRMDPCIQKIQKPKLLLSNN